MLLIPSSLRLFGYFFLDSFFKVCGRFTQLFFFSIFIFFSFSAYNFLNAKESIRISKIEPALADDLSKVEDYLNNIQNLSANFVQQTSGNPAKIEGKFYLSRNKDSAGKMRIEYLSKPKILIVVNGAVLSYVDIELDEISRLSTNTTPASLLTRPNISFAAKDIEIAGLDKSGEFLTIALRKKNRREAGEFRLTFRINPTEFIKMEVLNDLEQLISVKLSEINLETKIPDRLFVVKSQEN